VRANEPAAPLLRIDNVSYRYRWEVKPDNPVVLRDVSLTLDKGEFVSIVGPSGSGKSTILTLVAGLTRPPTGQIELMGAPVTGVRKDVGFVFQRDALLPWKSLRDNVALPLRYRGVKKKEAQDRAQTWLNRVGLAKFGDRYPHQVSGGQRKRASICATLVYEPSLMLMDEPFASLDVQTRDLIETDILRVWSENKEQTVLFVTHDLEEAVALSDRVIVVSRGPGTVISDHRIDLPRPRDVREIRVMQEFRQYSEAIWAELRDEVMAAQRDDDRH
jgi:NitT/TauT family transport system ATP-binding protein